MTGEELLAEIIIEADDLHLRWHHSYDAKRDRLRGFPDLVLAGPGGIVFAECKGEAEELSGDQVMWKWSLLSGGAAWFLWRPEHWRRHEIQSLMVTLGKPR